MTQENDAPDHIADSSADSRADLPADAQGSPVGAWRPVVVAAGYGAVAGAVTALALALMHGLQHVVWSVSDARWYIAVAILVGGVLLALLRSHSEDLDLDSQIAASADPVGLHRRRMAMLGVSAIIAVGFGGAIGPEAGLIAIVAELSALVSMRIARSAAEARAVGRAGTAAVLAGLYSSPPGAGAYDDDSLGPPKALVLLAAITGFVGFVVTHDLVSDHPMDLGLADYPGGAPLDLLHAVLPAAAGAAVAAVFVLISEPIARLFRRPRNVAVQTLLGTVVFAALVTAWPLVRFSGQTEIVEIVRLVQESAWPVLVLCAVLKVLATAINLASGWRGGAIFPLIFAGAAAGGACLGLLPGLHPTVALVAGLGAAATVGLRKPLAVLLICAFILGGDALGPLLVGVGIGMIAARALPEPASGH